MLKRPYYGKNSLRDFQSGYSSLASNAHIIEKEQIRVEQLYANLSLVLESESDATRKLGLSAYRAGSSRINEILRRVVQRNFRLLLREIFTYAKTVIEDQSDASITETQQLYQFVVDNKLGEWAFYQNRVNFNDSRFLVRSSDNIYDYLWYISQKERLYYKAKEKEFKHTIVELENTLNEHRKNIDEGELYLASLTLKKLADGNNSLLKMQEQFVESVSDAFFDTPYNRGEKENYEILLERLNKLSLNVGDESARLENTRIVISNLSISGDEKNRTAETLFQTAYYDDAEKIFEEAKNDYLGIIALTKSEQINAIIEVINRRLRDIESEIFRRDIELIEKYLQNGKKHLYNDEYVLANEEIKKAQELGIKHNQQNEQVENLRQRIETAIKLRRELTLNTDDAAYKNIIEWYENALRSLEVKDYKRAELFKDKILSEKPFYEKARQLEIRILQAKGDMEFFKAKYNQYFNEAMNYYTSGNYIRAVNGFKQLLDYDYDTRRLNELIHNSNVRLGLVAKPVAQIDRRKANSLVAQARILYEKEILKMPSM